MPFLLSFNLLANKYPTPTPDNTPVMANYQLNAKTPVGWLA
jgi:hypothetical protein